MGEISFTYLSGPDIAALEMTNDEILDAVEGGLRAQGEGRTVIEPRVHLEPDPAFRGHFNVLRGYVAPLDLAGVKVVGDYVDNYQQGLPSEMALLNLFDPRTGMPADTVPSVTVIAPRAVVADAWATALSVLGPSGLKLLPGNGDIDAMIVAGTSQDYRIYTTEGFVEMLPPGFLAQQKKRLPPVN